MFLLVINERRIFLRIKLIFLKLVETLAKDTLVHMKNTFIVKPSDFEELLSTINFLMDNPNKHEEIRLNALEEIKNHDWSLIGLKYLELYEKLLIHKN